MSEPNNTRRAARLDRYVGYVGVQQPAGGELVAFRNSVDRIVVMLGGAGGPTVTLTPEAWRIVIDTVTAVLDEVPA